MSMDPCVAMVGALRQKRWNALQKLVGNPLIQLGVYRRYSPQRLAEAVRKEVVDLDDRALAQLATIEGDAASRARTALQRGKTGGYFPRQELREIGNAGSALGRELSVWIEKHERLEKRLEWLLDPRGTPARLPNLDPIADCDEIWTHVHFAFRPEHVWGLWGNASVRVAQLESTATFFHSTGEAEGNALRRTEDTALLYAYFFNWGADSYHGRHAIETMNRIHGRYFIHNDGMKYVLLNAGFTILDGLERIGHRKLHDKERLGYFHAHVKMGRAMNIQNLSDDWDEMYGWFQTVNRENAAFSPHKRRCFLAIASSVDGTMKTPKPFIKLRQMFEFAGMDSTYRSAIGVSTSKRKRLLARSIMQAFAKGRASLPPEPDIHSLTTYLTYPEGGDVEVLGVKERSPRMPGMCPFSGAAIPSATKRNGGYPEDQLPLVDISDAERAELPLVEWTEVAKHTNADDLWVVIGGDVYDLSAFAKDHPGGLDILLRGAGRDLTRAFNAAKHTDITKVFALNYRIGRVAPRATTGDDHRKQAATA